jgi:probable HAF family extracellular repeat protein
MGINPAGEIVGASWNADQTVVHAFIWSKGSMTDLGPSGATYSLAWSINPKGDVVGQSGSGPISFSATLWSKK